MTMNNSSIDVSDLEAKYCFRKTNIAPKRLMQSEQRETEGNVVRKTKRAT